MTPDVIPPEDEVSEQVSIEVSPGGGHVGFIAGGAPWRPTFYLPGRILGFLRPNAAMPGL
jgi:predicted alpha/beta-fold hydrolase